jgi:hypothetical protein
VARVLIVGCGCRGRALGGSLVEAGHEVRGTSRSQEGLAPIQAAGLDAVQADPDRLGTLLAQLPGVSAVCWLMGSARDPGADAVHGPRWQSMLDKLVDTPVRGAVYEAAGTVEQALLETGAEIARTAERTHRMPVEVVEVDPRDHDAWLEAMSRAVDSVLSG